MDIKIFNDENKNIEFNQKGTELVILTDGIFRVEENIERMKLCLKGIILKSELVELLHEANITEHSLNDIEKYAKKYENDINVDIVKKAIYLYKMLEN